MEGWSIAPLFLTLAPDGGKSATRPDYLIHGERAAGTEWIGC
jgi:hypothetical protein